MNHASERTNSLELSRGGNHDLGAGGTRLGSDTFDGLDNVHAFDNLSKDAMLSIEPGGVSSTEEELTSVGVGSGYKKQFKTKH